MLGIWMVLTSLIKLVFLNWSTIFSSRLTALWKLTCYWETAIFTTPVLPFCWHGKEIKAKFIKCCSRVNPYWLFYTLYPFSGRAGQYICLHIFVSIRDRKFGIFWKWPIYAHTGHKNKSGRWVSLCICVFVCVCVRSHSYICALIRVFVCVCAGMFAGLQWTGDVSGVQTRQQRGTSVCHFLRHDRQHHPLHPCLGCQPERPVLCHTLPCHSCHLPLLQVMLVVKFEKPSQHSPYS